MPRILRVEFEGAPEIVLSRSYPLAISTNRVYSDWCGRYAKWVVDTMNGDELAVLDAGPSLK